MLLKDWGGEVGSRVSRSALVLREDAHAGHLDDPGTVAGGSLPQGRPNVRVSGAFDGGGTCGQRSGVTDSRTTGVPDGETGGSAVRLRALLII